MEGGRTVKAVYRECGIAEATYCSWKSKGGMEASDIKRLKEVEEENRHLKQRYAELSLDHKMLKGIVEKSCKASRTTSARRLREDGVSGESSTGLSWRVAFVIRFIDTSPIPHGTMRS